MGFVPQQNLTNIRGDAMGRIVSDIVSCVLLASSKEKNWLVPLRTDIDCRTNGARRCREGIRKATDVLVEMVAEATASGIQASHLPFDSWFAYPATMRNLLAKGMHSL
jgi:hypothetical protein